MKKLYALAASALVAVGSFSASAETVQNYVESFGSLTEDDVLEHDFAPKGWNHIVESVSSGWGGESYVTYSVYQNGGYEDSSYLAGGDQNIGSYGSTRDVNDLLVTPAVSGDVSMQLKLTKEGGSVKIFTVTEKDGEFTVGEEYSVALPELSTSEWTEVNLPSVAAGTYLGIRLEYAGIDEFTAASADIVLKKGLTVKGNTLVTESDVLANENGEITVGFNVTLENTGEVALEAGTYSVSLIDNSDDGAVLGTQTVDKTLPVGGTAEDIYVEATFKIELEAGQDEWYHRIDILENVSGTSVFGTWITAVPYEGLFRIREEGATSDLESLSFGMFQGKPVSKTVVLRNDGAKPVTVSAIDAPSGYTFDLSCPITLGADERKNLVITLGADEPGDHSGEIVFVNDGKDGRVSVPVSGTVIGSDTFYESFEEREVPQGWLVPDGGWQIVSDPNTDLQTEGNEFWMESSSVTDMRKLITPKLEFGAGETVIFRAAKRAQYTQSVLNVYYSADRQDWELVKTVDCDESTGNDHFSSNTVDYGSYGDNYEFSQFSAEIPQGEWYVAFEAGYCFLDDVYGGKRVTVDHDFYIMDSEMPLSATVNYEYAASVTVKNVNAVAEAAGAYAVKLYVNGEAVAEAKTEELAAGAEKTYTLAFTPHAVGGFTAYIEITAGNYKLATEEISGTVAAEQSLQKQVVGTKTGETREAPAFTFWKHSMTQTVYTADLLKLETGAKISKISFDGYNSSRDLTHHVKVWLQNTEDGVYETAEPAATDGMTLVYDSDYTFKEEGSSGDMVEMLVIPLAEQFEYAGKNLRVVVESRGDSSTSVYFAADNSVANTTIYKKTDGDDYETLTWSLSTAGMPVMNVYTEKTVLTVSGKVTDKENAAVEGATVTLTSGNVLYTGVTDAEGAYSVEVFQSEKDYMLTISKDGYKPFEQTVSFAEGNVVADAVLEEDGESGIDAAERGAMTVCGGQGVIYVNAGAAKTVSVYDLSGRLVRSVAVEEGKTELAGFAAGIYVVERQKVAVK